MSEHGKDTKVFVVMDADRGVDSLWTDIERARERINGMVRIGFRGGSWIQVMYLDPSQGIHGAGQVA